MMQWLFDDPTRAITMSILLVVIFGAVQFVLCLKIKKIVIKLIPVCSISLLGGLDVLLALGLFQTQSEGLANLHLLIALILGILIISIYIGIAIGWFVSIIWEKYCIQI